MSNKRGSGLVYLAVKHELKQPT